MYLFKCKGGVWYCRELVVIGKLKSKNNENFKWLMKKAGSMKLKLSGGDRKRLKNRKYSYLVNKIRLVDGKVKIKSSASVCVLHDPPGLKAPKFWKPDGVCNKKLSQSWGDRLVSGKITLQASSVAVFHDSTVKKWIEDMGRADSIKKEKKRRRKRRKTKKSQVSKPRSIHDMGKSFINPYSFVPLPESVFREKPRGHATASCDGLSGIIDVCYSMHIPLLLPADNPSNESYPGSSIRGSIRSVHEVLTKSCLREVDLDYVPVHREPLSTIDRKATLAVVIDSVNGRATKLHQTEHPVWVTVEELCTALDIELQDIKSGLRFTLTHDPVMILHQVKRRMELQNSLPSGSVLNHNTSISIGQWVVIVSDSKARRVNHSYYVAIAKLNGSQIDVDDKVWCEFQSLSQGTRDTQLFHQNEGLGAAPPAPHYGEETWPGVKVKYGNQVIGQRRQATGVLGIGDVVWQTSSGSLKMAYVWRRKGSGSVRERLGSESLEPCNDPDNLCVSCATFGMISKREDSENRHDQASYASHVRFLTGSLKNKAGTGPAKIKDYPVALLRSPKPSSGNFYLEHGENADLRYCRNGPKAHWGSVLDRPANRRIAGRKFYRHGQVKGDPNAKNHERQRQWYRNWDSEKPPEDERKMAVKGSKVRFKVAFDNLSSLQLAYLIVALDPRLLKNILEPKGQYANHLGGGKPLGFGTAVVEKVKVTYSRARDRYSGGKKCVWKTSGAGDPFDIVPLLKSLKKESWMLALCHLLDTKSVRHDHIWYPFLADGFNLERRNAKIDEAYRFFATFNGNFKKRGVKYPMRVAPPATKENQYIDASLDVEEG